jgi:hypothetical protein
MMPLGQFATKRLLQSDQAEDGREAVLETVIQFSRQQRLLLASMSLVSAF